MSRLRRAAAVMLVVFSGATAHAEESRGIDSVDTGESKSLDSVKVGESGNSDDQEAQSDTVDDTNAIGEARDAVQAAEERVSRATAAYSSMMARNDPQENGRDAIIAERDAAQRAYDEANAAYAAMRDQGE